MGEGEEGCPAPSNTGANSRPFLLRFQLDENHNHKPVFSNCSNYAPMVKEEEPPGTVVIQVHAEDRDPPEEGGIVQQRDIIASVSHVSRVKRRGVNYARGGKQTQVTCANHFLRSSKFRDPKLK